MALTEQEKRKIRMNLNFSKDYSVPANIFEGKLAFTKISHWNKPVRAYKLPREAFVEIRSLKRDPEGNLTGGYYSDSVELTPQKFEYLLDLMRQRIEHIKAQPGAMTRSDLLEEHKFLVDLICTLDI